MTELSESTVRGGGPPARRPAPRFGPDRFTVVLSSLAAFLAMLALLAGQIRTSSTASHPRTVIVLRRIYRTTVVETIPGRGSGTSESQSVSSSGSGSAALPTTRSSSHP